MYFFSLLETCLLSYLKEQISEVSRITVNRMLLHPYLLLSVRPRTSTSPSPYCPMPTESSQMGTIIHISKESRLFWWKLFPAPGTHITKKSGLIRWKPCPLRKPTIQWPFPLEISWRVSPSSGLFKTMPTSYLTPGPAIVCVLVFCPLPPWGPHKSTLLCIALFSKSGFINSVRFGLLQQQ